MNAKMKMTALLLAAVITLSFPLQTFAVNFDGLEEAVAPVAEPSSEQSMVEPDEIAIAAAPVPESNVSYAETPASPDNAAADPSETDVPESPAEDTLALPAVYDDTATTPDRRDTLLVDDSITLSGINQELSEMFNFTFDPYTLVSKTQAARYNNVGYDNGSSVFFKNKYVNGGNDYMSHKSDFLTFTNQCADPVYVAVQMSVSGLDEAGILMAGQKQKSSSGATWTAHYEDNAPRLKFTVYSDSRTAYDPTGSTRGIVLDYDVIPDTGHVFFEKAFYLKGDAESTQNTVSIARTDTPSAVYAQSVTTVRDYNGSPLAMNSNHQTITSNNTSVSFQLDGKINNSGTKLSLWDSIGDLDNASLTVTWKVWKVGTPYKYVEQNIETLIVDLANSNFGEYDWNEILVDPDNEFTPANERFSATIAWDPNVDPDDEYKVGNLLIEYGLSMTLKADGTIEAADFAKAQESYTVSLNGNAVSITNEDGQDVVTITFANFINREGNGETDRAVITLAFQNYIAPIEYDPAETLNIANPKAAFGTDDEVDLVEEVVSSATIEWVTGIESSLKTAITGKLASPGITITVESDGTANTDIITAATFDSYGVDVSADNTLIVSSGGNVCAKIVFTLTDNFINYNLSSAANAVRFGTTEPNGGANVTYTTETLTVINQGEVSTTNNEIISNIVSSATIQWVNGTSDSHKDAILAELRNNGVTVSFDDTPVLDSATVDSSAYNWDLETGTNNVVISDDGGTNCAKITFTPGANAADDAATVHLADQEDFEELVVRAGGETGTPVTSVHAKLVWKTTNQTNRDKVTNMFDDSESGVENNDFTISVSAGRVTVDSVSGNYQFSDNVVTIIDETGSGAYYATITFTVDSSVSGTGYEVCLSGADDDEMVDTLLVTLRFPTDNGTFESGNSLNANNPLFADVPEEEDEDSFIDADSVIDDVVTSGSSGSVHHADLDGSADADAAPEVEPVSADPDESPAEVVMDSTSGTDTAPDSTVDDEEDEIVTDDAVDTDTDSGNVGFSEANNMIPVQADPEEEGALNSMETVDAAAANDDSAESDNDSAESDDDAAESNDDSAVEETNDVAVVETSDDSAESGNDDAGTVETSDDATVDSSSESAVETSTETATSSDDSTSGSSSDSGSTSENSSDSASESSSDSAE